MRTVDGGRRKIVFYPDAHLIVVAVIIAHPHPCSLMLTNIYGLSQIQSHQLRNILTYAVGNFNKTKVSWLTLGYTYHLNRLIVYINECRIISAEYIKKKESRSTRKH